MLLRCPPMPTRRSILASLVLLWLVAAAAPPASAGTEGGYLGVQLQDLDETLRRALNLPEGEMGVLVADVVSGSPAAEAGIEKGDVVLRFDGATARSSGGLSRKVQRTEPGSSVEVEIFRRGETRSVQVQLGNRELDVEDPVLWLGYDQGLNTFFLNRPGSTLGMRVEELDEVLGSYFGTSEGLLVLDVIEDSPADEAGLRRGDVLTSFDGNPLREREDLIDQLEDRVEVEKLSLVYLRDREQATTEIEVDPGDDLALRFLGRGMQRAPRMHFFHHGEPLRGRVPAPDHNIEQWFERREDRPELKDELDQLREQVEELREQLKELQRS